MYNIGDKIKIDICLPDLCYTDDMMISYIVGNFIITCGHCLPVNSKIKFLWYNDLEAIYKVLKITNVDKIIILKGNSKLCWIIAMV